MLKTAVSPTLSIDNLTVIAKSEAGERKIVDSVTLSVAPGEALGVIGESGSGKSTLALAVMNYLAPGLRVADGSILFEGQDLAAVKHSRAGIYGKRIAHVAQDPAAALNPVIRVGRQLTEGMRKHLRLGPEEARRRAVKLLEEVRLTGGEALLDRYPYELSGGMQQRICIAMALACDPDLVILDEPTTGLDARTESAILEILAELKQKRKLSLLLISHNIVAVSDIANRIAVLYGGRLMECGPIDAVLKRPAHRYTKLLLNAVPAIVGEQRPLADIPWQESGLPRTGCPFRSRCDLAVEACADELVYRDIANEHISACVRWKDAASSIGAKSGGEVLELRERSHMTSTVLEADGVSFAYQRSLIGDSKAKVLNDVGLSIGKGEIVALIGESGSGKSTFARVLVGLLRAQAGRIGFRGHNLVALRRYPLEVSRYIQIVFQNIAGSLHPRKRVGDVIARPFKLYERRTPSADEMASLISPLGLRQSLMPRRSGALSGGERQRAALARANAPQPDVVVLDEAFSALDVSMKVRVARLIIERCQKLGTAILFVTHDLPFVRYIADKVAVLYRGWLCDSGPANAIFAPPYHPYTEALVWAARRLEGERPAHFDLAGGEPPLRKFAETGCPYQFECHRKLGAVCETTSPPRRPAGEGRVIACHIPVDELTHLQTDEYEQPQALRETAR